MKNLTLRINKIITVVITSAVLFTLPGMNNITLVTAYAKEAADTTSEELKKALIESLTNTDEEIDNEVIQISSASDLIEISKEAKNQSYSTGRTFSLNSNIDLSGNENVSIPFMDGNFMGNGHTITGLVLNEETSDYGLFRFVGEHGTISNLTVSADVTGGEKQQDISIVAGHNSGIIIDCTAKGVLNGQNQSGAIVGFNDETGYVAGCTNLANVDGKYQTGGIVGHNEGIIDSCLNYGRININTRVKKNSGNSDGTAVNISIPNAVTGIAADERSNETGGIAGYSDGIIRFCDNREAVGYKHLGDATGGVVGYQVGIVESCSNKATVYGHKNVGGIVGYFEPYEAFTYDKDYVEQLRNQLDGLSSLVNELADSGELMGNNMSGNVRVLSDEIKYLRKTVEGYAEDFDRDLDSARSDIREHTDEIKEIVDDMDYDFKVREIVNASNKLKKDIEKMTEDMVKLRLMTQSLSMEDYATFAAYMKAMEKALSEGKKAEYNAYLEKLVKILSMDHGSDHISKLTATESLDIDDDDDLADSLEDDKSDSSDEADDNTPSTDDNDDQSDNPSEVEETDSDEDTDAESDDNNTEETNSQDEQNDEASDDTPENTGADAEVSRLIVKELRYYGASENLVSENETESADSLGYLYTPANPATNEVGMILKVMQDLMKYDRDAQKQVNKISKYINTIPDELDDVKEDLEDIRDNFDDVYDASYDLLDKLDSRGDQMRADMRSQSDVISDTFDLTQDVIDADWDRFNRNIETVINQVDAIRATISDGYDEIRDRIEDRSVYVDISEVVDIDEGQGKVLYCDNKGEIYGDSLTGGIVGCIDKDESSDETLYLVGKMFGSNKNDDEEDDEEDKDRTLDSITKHVHATIYDCKNSSDICVEGDYAGGIVGRASYGYVKDCKSYCDVVSDEGKYIGGIAGLSKSAVDGSYYLGGLNGASYVGGVAGKADKVRDSYVCAYMDMDDTYVKGAGAIAGKVKEEATGNFFVDNGYGAIDGVTRATEAYGISYNDMISLGNMPKEFKEFTLKFVDENQTIWSGTFAYGDNYTENKYPELVVKDGEYVYWENKIISPIRRNVTVHAIRRVFFPSVQASVSENESPKPDMLLGGEFYPDTRLEVYTVTDDESARIEEVKKQINSDVQYVTQKSYRYKLNQEMPFDGSVSLRVLCGKLIPSNTLLILDKDMNPITGLIPAKQIGSYLASDVEIGNEGYIVMIQFVSKAQAAGVIAAVIIGLIILIVIIVLLYKKRKKNKWRANQVDENEFEDEGEIPESDSSEKKIEHTPSDNEIIDDSEDFEEE